MALESPSYSLVMISCHRCSLAKISKDQLDASSQCDCSNSVASPADILTLLLGRICIKRRDFCQDFFVQMFIWTWLQH